jgi:hypothetical protein
MAAAEFIEKAGGGRWNGKPKPDPDRPIDEWTDGN